MGFLMSGLVSRSLKASAVAFSSMWMLPIIHCFWLGYVRTVTVETSSMHLLMKPVTDVVYSSILSDEFRNIFLFEFLLVSRSPGDRVMVAQVKCWYKLRKTDFSVPALKSPAARSAASG